MLQELAKLLEPLHIGNEAQLLLQAPELLAEVLDLLLQSVEPVVGIDHRGATGVPWRRLNRLLVISVCPGSRPRSTG